MHIHPRPSMKVPPVIFRLLEELDNAMFVRENEKLYVRFNRIDISIMDDVLHIQFYWQGTPVHAAPICDEAMSNFEPVSITGITGRMEVQLTT